MPARTLVLVPTPEEARILEEHGPFPGPRSSPACCGFGVVASAARTARLLAEERPARVLLLGIAGTFEPARAPLGGAVRFGTVRIAGIGVGERETMPPSALGIPQWPDPPGPRVFEDLELAGGPGPELLTVCAASRDTHEARARRACHPGCLAEDMEGFAVALACRLAQVPVLVVRGFSNAVGDRHHAGWRPREALGAARTLALEWLERAEWGP